MGIDNEHIHSEENLVRVPGTAAATIAAVCMYQVTPPTKSLRKRHESTLCTKRSYQWETAVWFLDWPPIDYDPSIYKNWYINAEGVLDVTKLTGLSWHRARVVLVKTVSATTTGTQFAGDMRISAAHRIQHLMGAPRTGACSSCSSSGPSRTEYNNCRRSASCLLCCAGCPARRMF